MAHHNYWQDAVDARFAEMRRIIEDRHFKYGPNNILDGGLHGLIVRAQDKLARIRRVHEGCSAFGPCVPVQEYVDEARYDAHTDLANYIGVIYPMLAEGDWLLPVRPKEVPEE